MMMIGDVISAMFHDRSDIRVARFILPIIAMCCHFLPVPTRSPDKHAKSNFLHNLPPPFFTKYLKLLPDHECTPVILSRTSSRPRPCRVLLVVGEMHRLPGAACRCVLHPLIGEFKLAP